MGRLFGTDGIRGAANEYPLTADFIEKIGRAVATVFNGASKRAKIIIGKDTRLSGDMIEDALATGICSAGGEVCLAGILPTPAVAYLTASSDASAGIVISASHNPFFDNGIKIFFHGRVNFLRCSTHPDTPGENPRSKTSIHKGTVIQRRSSRNLRNQGFQMRVAFVSGMPLNESDIRPTNHAHISIRPGLFGYPIDRYVSVGFLIN